MAEVKPLVLDVDGTFLRTDMLLECLWAGLGQVPFATLAAVARHFRHPARLKAALAGIAAIRTDLLPVNPDLAELAMHSQSAGREVVLASASDRSLVARLAADYGFSDRILASDGTVNMKGQTKATALVAAFGDGGFDYAGDAKADLAVWERAENAIVVGRVAGLKRLGRNQNVVLLPGGWSLWALILALRPHQWLKNALLLLPLIAAHRFDAATLTPILIGIAVFSAAAAAIYIVNDLLDLEADRLHPAKCDRAFASGAVPIAVGMVASVVLGFGALVAAMWLNWAFFGIVVLYMLVALAYSLRLKRMRWVDVATLAGLYTLRVVAGAAAGQVVVSAQMLIFVFPVFITLGCVKRLTELTLVETDDRLPGRSYGRADRSDLLNVAGLGSFGALLVFFLYSVSAQGQELYPTSWLLWAAMLPMAAWLVRMVLLGWQGKQDYDPIIFALRDPIGLGLLMITLSLMLWAAGLWAVWIG